MIIILFLAFCFNLYYAVLLLRYRNSWIKLISAKQNKTGEKNFPDVSIIVPVRNEEENILQLQQQLRKINYPSGQYEIIFVNDHSTDNTSALIDLNNPYQKFFSLNDTSGKKAALETGIKNASHEWIVTIDADISFDENWLQNLMSVINPDVVMICGIVIINYHDLISEMQSMEFAILQASGAAALTNGKSLLNSGANLAFKKSAWQKVNGYSSHQQHASGDDTFLMLALQKEFPGKVIPNPFSSVTTKSANNFSTLLNQRLRWAGKTKSYNNFYISLTGFVVFISAFFLCVSVFNTLFFFCLPSLYLLGVLLTLRSFAEWNLLKSFSGFYKLKYSTSGKILMSLFYPFFLLTLILFMPFKKAVWKDRKL